MAHRLGGRSLVGPIPAATESHLRLAFLPCRCQDAVERPAIINSRNDYGRDSIGSSEIRFQTIACRTPDVFDGRHSIRSGIRFHPLQAIATSTLTAVQTPNIISALTATTPFRTPTIVVVKALRCSKRILVEHHVSTCWHVTLGPTTGSEREFGTSSAT